MKKLDYYTQFVLLCLAVLCLFTKIIGIHLGWIPAAVWILLAVWQSISAIALTLKNMESQTMRIKIQTYWMIIACALGINLIATYAPLCFPLSIYMAYGMAVIYYLWLTHKLAYYKREKALW